MSRCIPGKPRSTRSSRTAECHVPEQHVAGGAQDNGTVITPDGAPDTWFEWTGGDGGWVVFHPQNVNHIYSTAQNMRIFRHRPDGSFADVSPPEDNAVKENVWMVFVAMDGNDPSTLVTGSTRIWRTRDDADNWEPVSEVLDGSAVTALEIDPTTPTWSM